MADKVDLKKYDSYRAKAGQFTVVEVPPMQYLMVDGHGDPNASPAFTEAIEAIYPVAYKIKFASKRELSRDYVVGPLEGLWWSDDMATFTSARNKSTWDWTLLNLVPDWVTAAMFADAVAAAGKKDAPPRLGDVRLEPLDEGTVVQTLHVGSFDDESEVLRRMHEEFIPEHGYVMTGKHHEVYLSDFRKVEPTKLRTILRQPVR